MNSIINLNWPSLSEDKHSLIVNEIKNNFDLTTKATINDSSSILHINTHDNSNNSGLYLLTDWPNKQNFCNQIFNINKNLNFIKDTLRIQKTQTHIVPHTDSRRKFSIVYLVQGQADSLFFKKKENVVDKMVFKYDEIIEIEKYNLIKGNWYGFNNSVIHGVQNFKTPRYMLVFNMQAYFESYEDMINNSCLIKEKIF